MDSLARRHRLSRRYLLLAGLLLLAIYVLLPQFGDFRSSWRLLGHPDLGWTGLALALTALTYLSAAATYCLLAFKPLSYWRTALIQLAAMFLNRLLPGGLGALGTNYLFLKRNSHTSTQAAGVVAVNNLLGFAGHNLVFWTTVGLFAGETGLIKNDHSDSPNAIVKYFLIIAALLLMTALVFGRQKVKQALANVARQLLDYRRRPLSLLAGLASSTVLTLSNVGCLYACSHALGIQLSFAAIVVIFTFGISAATVTPTPGGLGGFEAGLVAGFVAYHVAGGPALAAALLFRFVTYWLTLAVGAVAFGLAGRRHYI